MRLIISNFCGPGNRESSQIPQVWVKFEAFRYATITWLFLFRRGPLRRTWPLCRPNRFWQRPAKMRATTRNAWDSVWSLSHNQCQLFRLRRWVKLERKEYGWSTRMISSSSSLELIIFYSKLKRMEFFFFRDFSLLFFFFDSINALINMVDAISTVAPWRLLELIQVFELTR